MRRGSGPPREQLASPPALSSPPLHVGTGSSARKPAAELGKARSTWERHSHMLRLGTDRLCYQATAACRDFGSTAPAEALTEKRRLAMPALRGFAGACPRFWSVG